MQINAHGRAARSQASLRTRSTRARSTRAQMVIADTPLWPRCPVLVTILDSRGKYCVMLWVDNGPECNEVPPVNSLGPYVYICMKLNWPTHTVITCSSMAQLRVDGRSKVHIERSLVCCNDWYVVQPETDLTTSWVPVSMAAASGVLGAWSIWVTGWSDHGTSGVWRLSLWCLRCSVWIVFGVLLASGVWGAHAWWCGYLRLSGHNVWRVPGVWGTSYIWGVSAAKVPLVSRYHCWAVYQCLTLFAHVWNWGGKRGRERV